MTACENAELSPYIKSTDNFKKATLHGSLDIRKGQQSNEFSEKISRALSLSSRRKLSGVELGGPGAGRNRPSKDCQELRYVHDAKA